MIEEGYYSHRCIECSLMKCHGPNQRCESESCQAAAEIEQVARPQSDGSCFMPDQHSWGCRCKIEGIIR